MITTHNADEIIESVIERIEIGGVRLDETYPRLNVLDRNDLIIIIKEIGSD